MRSKKKRLNIAIILPTIVSKNGTAKQSLELAKKLSEKGHRISFFTFAYLKGSSFQEFEKFNIYFCIDINKSIIHKFVKNVSTLEKIYLYMGLILISRFRNLFKNKKIDMLNPHDWFGLWVSSGLDFQKAAIIANINDVPNRLCGNFWDKFKLAMDRKYSKKLSAVIVLDCNNKKRVKEWLKLDESKIVVVRSGIDVNKFKNFKSKLDLRKQIGINKNTTLLVCANLLAPNRRYEDVLCALGKLKNNSIHLIILSKLDFDIKYANILKKIIKDNKLTDSVHFIDKFFTDEERMKYIKSCDVLIFPNSPQTWGLTVIETMALGLPVVVSTGAGVSEVLHDGENAILFKERDCNELYVKLVKYLNARGKLAEIANKGKEYVIKTFSWEKSTEKEETVMYEALTLNE